MDLLVTICYFVTVTTMTREQTKPIIVSAQDPSRVLFADESEDRFVLSCAEAVYAAQSHLGRNVIAEELRALIKHSQGWFRANPGGIRDALLAVRGSQLMIFVVPESASYDSALGAKLSDLDI